MTKNLLFYIFTTSILLMDSFLAEFAGDTTTEFHDDYDDIATESNLAPPTTEDDTLFDETENKQNESASAVTIAKPPLNIIVEVAIVCDKEFADLHQHNRQKLLNFWTVYFWDISARFRTLQSTQVTFHVTSLTIISNISDQPFIENARDKLTRKVSHDRINPLFQKWVYTKLNELPTFDIAMLSTNADVEWRGGQAYFRGACQVDHSNKKYLGCMLADGQLGSVPHEIAHLLGAHHDGGKWCRKSTHSGFIMEDHVTFKAHAFSPCSDHFIALYVGSQTAACLSRDNVSSTAPILDPDFDTSLPPTIKEQCETLSPNSKPKVRQVDVGHACQLWTCQLSAAKSLYFSPVANTECGHGKICFHGKCVRPGRLLVNVGSGQCVSSTGPWLDYAGIPVMVACPRSSLPTDRFHSVNEKSSAGSLLIIPYQAWPNKIHQFFTKCLSFENEPNTNYRQSATFHDCNSSSISPLLGWDMVDTGTGSDEFLLLHRTSGKCATTDQKHFLGNIWMISECDVNNSNSRWKFESVLPLPQMCPQNDNCEADLQAKTYLSENNISRIITARVELTNYFGVAVAPSALISWKANLNLNDIPGNCVKLNEFELKCKVGRILREKETVQVAAINFDTLEMEIAEDFDLESHLGIKVTPIAASKIIQRGERGGYNRHVGIIVFGLILTFILTICISYQKLSDQSVRRVSAAEKVNGSQEDDDDVDFGESKHPEKVRLTHLT